MVDIKKALGDKLTKDPFGFLQDSIDNAYLSKEAANKRLETAEHNGDKKAIKKERKIIKEIDGALADLNKLIDAMTAGNLATAGALLVKYQAKMGKDILSKRFKQ